LRLIRLARLAKVGRYSEAAGLLVRVLREKREELILTMSLLLTLAVIFAALLFFVEGDVQPDKLPNIGAALWWSIVTITTVGYGDVYPVTPLGKVIGVFTTLIGVLMIALPTGVFGAAFVQELDRKKRERKTCPHCGKEIS
jgi:voltage-gated potassium channel